MKKLLLTVSILFLTARAHAFDVYQSSSPVTATSGVLCSTGTVAYLYSVCVSSPGATGEFTQVYGSTFSTSSQGIPRTRIIAAQTFGCIQYQANYGTNGLFYAESSGQTHVITYNYLCN
jgi:hypothetical protein